MEFQEHFLIKHFSQIFFYYNISAYVSDIALRINDFPATLRVNISILDIPGSLPEQREVCKNVTVPVQFEPVHFN